MYGKIIPSLADANGFPTEIIYTDEGVKGSISLIEVDDLTRKGTIEAVVRNNLDECIGKPIYIVGATYDDIVDSPNWDTYPTPGQATNWSLRNGVYTVEGPSVPDQIIAYRDFNVADVAISATVLEPFTSNTQADNFLACRIKDTDNYIGCRYNQNGFIVSQVLGGVITNFSTLLVTPPFTIRVETQGNSIRVYYNGALAADVTTDVVDPGRVGIVGRANQTAVPLGIFRSYSAIDTTAPLFELNLVNPQGVETRAPGNCYAWDGSQFKRFSDPSAPIIAGVTEGQLIDTPFVIAGGARFYPWYPRWEKGATVLVGDKYWLNMEDGSNKVVTMTQAITLPEMLEADPATYTVGPNYIPELGYVMETATTQLAKESASGIYETLGPGVVQAGSSQVALFEGMPAPIFYQHPDGSTDVRDENTVSFSAGDEVAASFIVEIHPNDILKWDSFNVALRTAQIPAQVSGVTIGNDKSVAFTGTRPTFYKIEKLASNIYYVRFITQALIGSASSARLTLTVTTKALQTARVATHCKNIYAGRKWVQPIPDLATRPGNTVSVIGEGVADWDDKGMNENATVMHLAEIPFPFNAAGTTARYEPLGFESPNVISSVDGGKTNVRLYCGISPPGSYIWNDFPVADARAWTTSLMSRSTDTTWQAQSVQAPSTPLNQVQTNYPGWSVGNKIQLNVAANINGFLRNAVYWNDSSIMPADKFNELFGPQNYKA